MNPRLSKQETRTSLKSFNLNAGLRSVYDAVSAPTTFIFVAFLLGIGIPSESMGMVTALLSLACLFQLASLPLLRRVENRKRFVLSLVFIEPLMLLLAILLVPFAPHSLRLPLFLAALAIGAVAIHLASPVSADWMASTVPEEVRGRFFGRRSQLQNAIFIVTSLIAGFAADGIEKSNPHLLKWVLVAGALFGLLAVLPLRKARFASSGDAIRIHWGDLREIFYNRPFRRLLLGYAIYSLPFYFASPYYQVFNLDVLAMKKSAIACVWSGYFLIRVLISPYMGRKIDQHGPRKIALMFAPLYVFHMFCYPISSAGYIWPIVIGWTLVSIADAAVSVAYQSALYSVTPEGPNRPAYFAVSSIALLGGGALGGLLAVCALKALRNAALSLGPLVLGQFHIYYLLIAISLIPCCLGLGTLPDRKP